MITDKELNLINLSATKKDFYQIWNELLEAAKKTTERWDPESTNESDPGIVLLKLLTACADRLNYNIDKNTLEAFMPSAAQEESMRKLCDMMGYAIKYYRSATTDVTVSYIGNLDNADERLPESGLYIPIFTSITNADKDINYVTTSQAVLLNDQTQVVVPCIEGQIVRCESDTDNIITLAQLDDNNRYYLPELQVAENGIFVYNINDNIKSNLWESVDNLNTQPTKAKVFKFGFDSQEYRPYLQFPNDISSLIEDGLEIYYVRTSGVLGNISARSLSTLEKPTDESWDNYQSSDSFIAINYSPTTNGTNPETLTQAYNAFKKTVGTFDTLVTCRDYINKIYSLTLNKNTPLVSNVIVSDIRDDINRAQVICSFNDFGLCYVDKSLKALDDKGNITSDDAITPFDLVLYPFRVYNNLNTKADYQGSFTYSSANFNLIQTMLAKSKTIAHRLTKPNIGTSTGDSETSKKDSEIVCIKNYLKLNAKISTTSKVNSIEAALIIENIKANLFSLFNARQVDFGQEIPFDLILEGIENADTRIKNVALEEPILYTKVALADGREFDIASEDTSGKKIDLTKEGKKYYNKLALRNILAGRIRLFNYTNDFNYSFTESDYGTLDTVTTPAAANELGGGNKEASKNLPDKVTENEVGGGLISEKKNNADVYHYAPQYPIDTTKGRIDKLTSELIIDPSPANITKEGGITLNPHEVIKFRAPNFITTKTYPAYVNYYLHLSESSQHSEDAIPATFKTLGDFMYGTAIEIPGNGVNASALPYLHVENANAQAKTNVEGKKYAEWFINWLNEQGGLKDKTIKEFNINVTEVDNYRKEYGGVFSFEDDHTLRNCYSLQNSQTGSGKLNIAVIDWNNQSIFVKLSAFIKQIQYSYTPAEQTESQTGNLSGVYRVTSAAGTHIIGYCVDAAQISYGICTIYRQFADPLQDGFYIQETHAKEDPGDKKSYTCDGLGKDASTDGISADTEYQLKNTEYLLINYLPSSTSGDANAATEPVNVYYGANTIIKPNFLAVDSAFRHDNLGKGWAKTDGYDFSRANASVTNPSGMFALGASEQIEIRNLVTVILSGNVNLCWRLNTENNSIDQNTNYTLGPGEFIYYTNDKKVDIAYYGEGTEVCTGTQGLVWPAGEKVITELEADGLGLADMPWQPMYLTEAKQIVLKEYQYVTLTEGDTLLSLHISESELSGKDDAAHKDLLCNIWKPCTSSTEFPARYSMGDTQYNLPRIAVDGESWAVRSLLEFASGPDTTQTLYREGASITAYNVDEKGGERKIITLKPDVNEDGVVRPLSFKTSLDLVASVDKLSFTYKTGTTDNSTQATDTNVNSGKALSTQKQVQIRLFEDKPINIESGRTAKGETTSSVVGNTSLVLHNLGSSYTKLSMANLRTDNEQDIKYIKLPVVVPSTTARAVMMVYYKPEAESGYTELDTDNAALGILDKESSYELKIFNNPSDAGSEVLSTYMSSWTWWKRDGGEEAKAKDEEGHELRDADGNVLGKLTRYYLKPGLNIVSITESTTLYILPDAKKKAMIIFGDPTLYSYDDTTGGLATALLGYKGEDNVAGSPALTLLKDLKAADTENQFFYNCDIENDVAINLSEDRLFSDETETLAAERTWYDSNNINNKFVISEIDADYLDTGLQILKSSRY